MSQVLFNMKEENLALPFSTEPEPTLNYVEMINLVDLQGIYVTEDPRGHSGARMWCGYCCKPLHFDHRHLGTEPFLSLMVKMADAHRQTECPDPKGPFVHSWHPHGSREWARWADEAYRARQAEQEAIQDDRGDNRVAQSH